jgi:hypothetical protein
MRVTRSRGPEDRPDYSVWAAPDVLSKGGPLPADSVRTAVDAIRRKAALDDAWTAGTGLAWPPTTTSPSTGSRSPATAATTRSG